MAKQKRINKNLVAFLTVMGMILIVSIFGLVTGQLAYRNPEAFVEDAVRCEQRGELERAALLYARAYRASNDEVSRYLIKSARCWFELGDLGQWRNGLEHALAKTPEDRELILALLEGLWRTRELRGGGALIWPTGWRDHAIGLLVLDPNDPLGLASGARGLWDLNDEGPLEIGFDRDNWLTADEAARKAFELAPENPRVALTYVEYLRRQAGDKLERARMTGRRQSELAAIDGQFRADAAAALAPAVEQHPGNPPLVTAYVPHLESRARRIEVLQRALEVNPESPDLPVALASYLFDQLRARVLADAAGEDVEGEYTAQLSAAERAGRRAECDRIVEHAARAIELEPAMYDAYLLKAQVYLFAAGRGPDGENLPLEARREAALNEYEQAKDDTLLLMSMRVRLTGHERMPLLRQGFVAGLQYAALADSDEQREERMARAALFLEDARVKDADNPITLMMEGQYQMAREDHTAAIRAFEDARAKCAQRYPSLRRQALFWFQVARAPSVPATELAALYRQGAQLGEALQYADEAVEQYAVVDRVPPLRLLAIQADLLTRLGRAQDALDTLDQFRAQYVGDQTFSAARASALIALGRTEEAEREGLRVTGTDVPTQLWRAGKAHALDDLDSAEQILRAAFSDPSASTAQRQSALRMLMAVMEQAGRDAEALQFVQDQLANPPAGLRRHLQGYEVFLSEEDPDRRDEKLLEIVAAIPEAYERAEGYFNLYVSRDAEKSLGYLEEMKTLRPNELQVVEREFRLRLRLRQYDQAEKLLVPLSQADDGAGFDDVGGATYRAALALARGDAETAIREYRHAVLRLPKSDALETDLARAYLTAGRVPEAIDALRRATEVNPRSFNAHRLLVVAYDERAGQTVGEEKQEYERLAEESLAHMTEINPNHPAVREAQRRAAEKDDPLAAIETRQARWAEYPDDAENLLRLGLLYSDAWDEAEAQGDAAVQELTQRAHAFFAAVLPQATDETRLVLAQRAAGFYAVSGGVEAGRTFLRDLVQQQSGLSKIEHQMLLAQFMAVAGNLDAAEREYQEAQRMVGAAITDPGERQRADLAVGRAFIDFYERQRRMDKVIDACRWLLDRFGTQAGAGVQHVRLTLINALLSAGLLSDAEDEIREYLGVYGEEDLRGLTARARLHLIRSERDAAHADLTRVLKDNPHNAWALAARGGLGLQQADYEAARADLTAAEALIEPQAPFMLEVRSRLASLYQRTGEPDLAASQLREMLAILEDHPEEVDRKQQIVRQLARMLYLRMNQFDQAQRLISEYMERHPDEPIWPFELGQLFEFQAEQDATTAAVSYSSAATYYQRAVDAAGADAVWASRATAAHLSALVKAKRYRDVVEAFLNLGDMLPTPAMHVSAARAYQRLNQRQAAGEQWQRALITAGHRSIELAGMAATELRQSVPPDRADEILQQVATAQPPESPAGLRLRLVLASHRAAVGEPTRALPVLTEVLAKVRPGAPEHLSALLTRALVYDQTGDAAEAVATYRDVLRSYPDNVSALNNLAYLLVTSDQPSVYRPREALTYAERLRALVAGTPNAGLALDTVGWVYFKNEQLALATAALEEGLSLNPENLALPLHLGQVYQQQGRLTEARTMLNRGLDMARARGDEDYQRQFEEQIENLR